MENYSYTNEELEITIKELKEKADAMYLPSDSMEADEYRCLAYSLQELKKLREEYKEAMIDKNALYMSLWLLRNEEGKKSHTSIVAKMDKILDMVFPDTGYYNESEFEYNHDFNKHVEERLSKKVSLQDKLEQEQLNNQVLLEFLHELRNNYNLWTRPRKGMSKEYAGKPVFVQQLDVLLMENGVNHGSELHRAIREVRELRPEILEFAKYLETIMKHNDFKGDLKDCEPRYLFSKILDAYGDLARMFCHPAVEGFMIQSVLHSVAESMVNIEGVNSSRGYYSPKAIKRKIGNIAAFSLAAFNGACEADKKREAELEDREREPQDKVPPELEPLYEKANEECSCCCQESRGETNEIPSSEE